MGLWQIYRDSVAYTSLPWCHQVLVYFMPERIFLVENRVPHRNLPCPQCNFVHSASNVPSFLFSDPLLHFIQTWLVFNNFRVINIIIREYGTFELVPPSTAYNLFLMAGFLEFLLKSRVRLWILHFTTLLAAFSFLFLIILGFKSSNVWECWSRNWWLSSNDF